MIFIKEMFGTLISNGVSLLISRKFCISLQCLQVRNISNKDPESLGPITLQEYLAIPSLIQNLIDLYQTSQFVFFSSFVYLSYSCISILLGNHEFDDGVLGFEPFLANTSFPIVCCNIDHSKEPELKGDEHIVPSITLEFEGTKVGIIGYVTTLTPVSFKLSIYQYIF